jgi:hypothetical protein
VATAAQFNKLYVMVFWKRPRILHGAGNSEIHRQFAIH